MEQLTLIFLPGISQCGIDQSAAGISAKLASVFDTQSKTDDQFGRMAQFRSRSVGSIDFDEDPSSGAKRRADCAEVIRSLNGEAQSRLVVYVVQDVKDSVESALRRPPWSRLLRVLFTLLVAFAKLRKLFSFRSHGTGKAWAVFWASLVMSSLVLYFLLLVLAVTITVLEALPHFAENFDHLWSWIPRHEYVIPWSAAALVVINSFVLPFLPETWRRALAESTQGWLVLLDYMNNAESTTNYTRSIAALIEHLEQTSGTEQNVYVIGYSFGSVLGADAIFPRERATPPGALTRVRSFASVGFPQEPLNVFWPSHFRDRTDPLKISGRWVNVSVDGDPISTRFHLADGDRASLNGKSEPGPIPATELRSGDWTQAGEAGFVSQLLLRGVASLHGSYWGNTSHLPGCFVPLVPAMFESTVMLDGPPAAATETHDAET
ncbi:MAG: hypothetical protein AAGI17_00870 [Planctomycetota bacterium]